MEPNTATPVPAAGPDADAPSAPAAPTPEPTPPPAPSPPPEPPELVRCRQIRDASRPLVTRLTESVSPETALAAAHRLGLVHDGRLRLGDEAESAMLYDFAVFNHREGGRTAVERALATAPPPEGSDERLMLEAMQRARFTVLSIAEVLDNHTVKANDLVWSDSLTIVDEGLGQTAKPGTFLAARLIPLPEFWMTGWAALSLDALTIAYLARSLAPLLGKNPAAWPKRMNPSRTTDVAAMILSRALTDRRTRRLFGR